VLDQSRHTVRFLEHGVNLDPGGVGKGYAVDKMVGILRMNGIDCALVSGRGSSIYGMGAPPDNRKGWYVRVRDPRDERKTAAESLSEQRIDVDVGKLRKIFLGRR